MSAIVTARVAHLADDDVTVEGRARWARAWHDLLGAAARVVGYEPLKGGPGDLWRAPHGGAAQPLDVLVHEVRRALRRGGPKRRGFERALVEAELAQVFAGGWVADPADLAAPLDALRYSSPGGSERLTLAAAAARCRAEALRDELALSGPARADGPALVRDGYDQRQAEGDEGARALGDLHAAVAKALPLAARRVQTGGHAAAKGGPR